MEHPPPSDATALPVAIETAERTDVVFWRAFGFTPILLDPAATKDHMLPDGHDLGCLLPENTIAFTVARDDAKDIGPVLDGFPMTASLNFQVGTHNFFLFRSESNAGKFDSTSLPRSVRLLMPGDLMPLPTNPILYKASSLAGVAEVLADLIKRAVSPKAEPEIVNSPLVAFSLRGQAAKFEQRATDAKPLLGQLCHTGQVTVLFAPPNAGKTLITLKLVIDAVASDRINPANIYYINADDSSSGFAAKMRLMDDLGVHTLAPGFKGLKSENLITVLHDVATQGKARGTLIIIDTVKKFVSLMDKSKASAFSEACRQVAVNGGAILGLAHTTKNPNPNGKLRYAGTTDMVDDCDAAYVMTPREGEVCKGEKVVLFDNIKRRGNNAQRVAYAYAGEGDISYEERLASVHEVDPDQLEDFGRIEAERADADVITVVAACIADGVTAKMALGKEAAVRAKISERAAIRLIETYTGNEPSQHHWTYTVKDRGAKIYALLPRPEAEDVRLAA